MSNKYIWHMNAFAKGIDPDEAVEELERIEKEFGSLTPENILLASTPENALLHKLFDWDNDLAANKYRLQQARTILNNIEIHVILEGSKKQVPVYEVITRDSERSYKNIKDFTVPDVEQIRAQAVREINSWKNKLAFFNKFKEAIKKMDEAIELLN